MGRAKIRKAARRCIARGQAPRFRLALDRREVVEMPWLKFGGNHPSSITEAARRAVAAELKVRPEEIELEDDAIGPTDHTPIIPGPQSQDVS